MGKNPSEYRRKQQVKIVQKNDNIVHFQFAACILYFSYKKDEGVILSEKITGIYNCNFFKLISDRCDKLCDFRKYCFSVRIWDDSATSAFGVRSGYIPVKAYNNYELTLDGMAKEIKETVYFRLYDNSKTQVNIRSALKFRECNKSGLTAPLYVYKK